MRAGRPSGTAHLVALGRAMADAGLSHVADFHDPTARVFLSDKGRKSLAKTEQAYRAGGRGFRVAAARTMADMMALRTSAIDAAVRAAIADGARQLVILGAGYDGRAWRLSELAGVKVFEVDHPATQSDKRTRVAQLPPAKGIVTFVPVNFERDALATALERAGHDPASPTCWIWEGVVMYLTREAVRATLAAVAQRSSPGSTLIINYHTTRRGLFAQLIFRLIGEPQISAWSPAEMAADLHAAGFEVREDSGMTEWNERFAQRSARVDRGYYMHVVVARK
jgi:methyltransferase (TIGR00027 family)